VNFEAKDSFLKEYNYKLTKMYKIFYTKEAKRLSRQFKKVSEKFYKNLLKQIEINEINNIKFDD
jgi:hypothetical protein